MPSVPRMPSSAARRVLASIAATATLAAGATVLGTQPWPSRAQQAAAGVTAGIGDGDYPWHRIADSPLSPRFDPAAVWTGKEALVFGGYTRACSGVARQCGPLADGAAYDPATDTWRPIAPMPHRYHRPEAVLVGRTVYALSERPVAAAVPPDEHGARHEDGSVDEDEAVPFEITRYFLAYSTVRDEWTVLPPPTAGTYGRKLAVVDGRLIAYGRESVDGDLEWDPHERSWVALPAQPHRFGGRTMFDIGGDAVAVGAGDSDMVVDAARLDLDTGTWTALPSRDDITSYGRPDAAAGRVVFANDSLRGGVLDPGGAGAWTDPPARPGAEPSALAHLQAGGGDWVLSRQDLLNVRTGTWTRVPSKRALESEPRSELRGNVALWMGDRVLVRGGHLAEEDPARNAGWTLTPDRAR
jgi:hypothetical protein